MLWRFEFHGGYLDGVVALGNENSERVSHYLFLTDHARTGARFRELPPDAKKRESELWRGTPVEGFQKHFSEFMKHWYAKFGRHQAESGDLTNYLLDPRPGQDVPAWLDEWRVELFKTRAEEMHAAWEKYLAEHWPDRPKDWERPNELSGLAEIIEQIKWHVYEVLECDARDDKTVVNVKFVGEVGPSDDMENLTPKP